MSKAVMILGWRVSRAQADHWRSLWTDRIYVGYGPDNLHPFPIAAGQTYITMYDDEVIKWFADFYPEGQFYNPNKSEGE